MIIERKTTALEFLSKRETLAPLPPFNSVLMAEPTFFEVAYAINPYMTDSSGKLQQVNKDKARQEWDLLAQTFRKIGLEVSSIPGVPELPDIVFTANQTFPFWNSLTHRYEILLSHMRSSQRAPEVPYFKNWFEKKGFVVNELQHSGAFEGNGDAIFSPAHGVVFGGFGPRTDKEVYEELSSRFGLTVVRLELKSKDFYHLDTCFSILSKDVAVIQPEAFTVEGIETIRCFFKTLIEIPYQENIQSFCGNCFCPDGENVVLQKNSATFAKTLTEYGFKTWELETNEFMKSGGSVFCLKLFFLG